MKYTEQEEKEMNQQLKKWQERQLKAVRQNYIENAFERMNDIDRNVWRIIANANTYKDVNWLVWQQADRVIDKYCKIARKKPE